MCGGTVDATLAGFRAHGLSPRVRGNQIKREVRRHHQRSIPACAGEPEYAGRVNLIVTVYPRVCGGTIADAAGINVMSGLSPRVRGNHRRGWVAGAIHRSIPACAGEPGSVGRAADSDRVYPRVCG